MNPLVIKKGSQFTHRFRWSGPPYVYRPITAIANTAPVRFTVANHGMFPGWRFAVSDAKGLTDFNSEYDPPRRHEFFNATVVDVNTFEVNTRSALSLPAHTANTGVIRYLTPVDLTQYPQVRMQLREYVEAEDVLFELTTENGGIEIDTANHYITLNIHAATTEGFTFYQGVFSLEAVDTSGEAHEIVAGSFIVDDETTRPVLP